MIDRPKSLFVVLLAAALSISSPAQPADASKVTIVGCPVPGVEASCLVIRNSDGTVYDISAAKPRPEAGQFQVSLTGTKSEKLSICQQGIILDQIRWSYTKDACSKP